MKNSGQALTFLLVLLPVLITLGGITIRTGKALLVHQRMQNHCNEKALDAAAEQAKGLQALGKLNPLARRIIDMRRQIDRALAAGSVTPIVIPQLLAAEESLREMQITIAAQQKHLIEMALAQSLKVEERDLHELKPGMAIENFGPKNLDAPHGVKSSLKLHLQDETGYVDEIGAPKVKDLDFDLRQKVWGLIKIHTESFLNDWPGFRKSPPMDVSCEATVKMKNLEEKWSVDLTPSTVKVSSKPY